jgi:hypothetical protein
MAQDTVKRNVAEPAMLPEGREGRRSKSLTLAQPSAILDAIEGTKMRRRSNQRDLPALAIAVCRRAALQQSNGRQFRSPDGAAACPLCRAGSE